MPAAVPIVQMLSGRCARDVMALFALIATHFYMRFFTTARAVSIEVQSTEHLASGKFIIILSTYRKRQSAFLEFKD